MKKILKSMVAMVAAAAALTACKAELTESLELTQGVSFSVEEMDEPKVDAASGQDEIDTRAVFGTASGTSVPVLWTSNVSCVVIGEWTGNYKAQNFTIAPSSDGKTAKLNGNAWDLSGASNVYFYFVSGSQSGFIYSHGEKKLVFHIPTEQTPLDASPDENAMILGAKTSTYTKAPTTVKFSPNHLTAYIRLNLTNLGNIGTVQSVTVTATKPLSGKVNLNVSASAPALVSDSSGSSNSVTAKTSKTSNIWLACLPAQVAGTKLTIKVTGSSKTLTREITVPAGKNLTAGKIATMTVDMNPSVHVTGVTLNKTFLALNLGETETLTATVTPSNASDKTVRWSSSSNPNVASVTSAGVVKGVAPGNATITVTTNDGGKTATCSVNVINNAVRVEFGFRVRQDDLDYNYDAGEDVFHMNKNSTSGIFTYYVYYADGRTGYCEGTWKLSVISGSGISISGTRAITCTEAGKTAVVRLSSDLEPGVYSDLTVKTWDVPTSVAITEQVDLSVNRYGILGWVKEGTTSRVSFSVQPSTARQKVVVWKKENDSGWTVEQTGALQFKITAPSVRGSSVSAYTAKAMTVGFTCQTGKGLSQTFTPTNIDLTQPKLLDYVSYNTTSKQYRIDDGGLRIQILASDGLGTQDFNIVSKPYTAVSGYSPVAIVTGFCPGQIPKNTIASTNFPYVNYYYADDLGNNRSATLTKGEFHGFAIALKDCDESYWSAKNGDVDKSEHWNRSYGVTQYSHMTKNAFDLTVLAAYHNGQLGSEWCIYPVDRVWRYPDPGFEYDVRAWPSIASYKMRPWVMPTVANFWMLRDGDGKLQGGNVINQLNIRINYVAGEKIFDSGVAKSYWTISTYSDSQAYCIEQSVNRPYPYDYNIRSKQWVLQVRPFMVF